MGDFHRERCKTDKVNSGGKFKNVGSWQIN